MCKPEEVSASISGTLGVSGKRSPAPTSSVPSGIIWVSITIVLHSHSVLIDVRLYDTYDLNDLCKRCEQDRCRGPAADRSRRHHDVNARSLGTPAAAPSRGISLATPS